MPLLGKHLKWGNTSVQLTVLSMCIGSTSARLAPIFILSLWIPRMSSFLKFKGKNLQGKYILKTYFPEIVMIFTNNHVPVLLQVSHTGVFTCWLTCSCSCFSFFGTAHHLKMKKWSHCCGWRVSFCDTSTEPGYLQDIRNCSELKQKINLIK